MYIAIAIRLHPGNRSPAGAQPLGAGNAPLPRQLRPWRRRAGRRRACATNESGAFSAHMQPRLRTTHLVASWRGRTVSRCVQLTKEQTAPTVTGQSLSWAEAGRPQELSCGTAGTSRRDWSGRRKRAAQTTRLSSRVLAEAFGPYKHDGLVAGCCAQCAHGHCLPTLSGCVKTLSSVHGASSAA